MYGQALTGPVAGVFHSGFLLIFVLAAADAASFIPLASLAGVLLVVAWNMIERDAIVILLRTSAGEAAVLLVTFALTAFRDLTEAIVVGFALGAMLFIYRMSKIAAVETESALVADDLPDSAARAQDSDETSDRDIAIYRISGAFFFGAAGTIASLFDRIGDKHRVLILDFASVPFIDSTGAHAVGGLVRKAHHRGLAVFLTGTSTTVRQGLVASGLKPPQVRYKSSIAQARASATAPAPAEEDRRAADR